MWDPLQHLYQKIKTEGGFVNAHAHLDRAFSVIIDDLTKETGNVHKTLQEKWKLIDKFKKETKEEVFYKNIIKVLKLQKQQNINHCLSFIDCDDVVQEKAIFAAKKAKVFAQKELKLNFLIACQTLKGVIQKNARKWFEFSLEYVDIIGGLPAADRGFEQEHIDILLMAAKQTGKRVHVHVDQLNTSDEKETELLARRTIAHGLEGKVTAIHGISIATHPEKYRQELYKLCYDAGLSFVACPTAWLDSKRNEMLTPTHNSVTPIDEMLPAGLTVALGSDNIFDIYKPFSDGHMATELRVLLEANHFYEIDELVKIATSNGKKVLGISEYV
jgi:cytosine/adenosine deaminase-related metal-dependent hydrolase